MSNAMMKKSLLLGAKHRERINEWFALLQDQSNFFNGQRYNGRQLRAELRHAELPYGVLLLEGARILGNALFQQTPKLAPAKSNYHALAVFVAVAAHVKRNDEQANFATQLGEKISGSDRAYLSSLRFEKLLRAQTIEEFCRLLIRAIKIRGDAGINLFSLADSIFLWVNEWHDRQQNMPANLDPFKRNSVRWAMDYCLVN